MTDITTLADVETEITDTLPDLEAPLIRTELPGPKAREIIELDHKYLSPSVTRPYDFVMKQGLGAVVQDVDGNVFLDFNAGIAVCSTGHCHPRVVAAIKEQADKFLHYAGTDFYYEVQARLAEKLAKLAPGNFEKRIFFGNTGTEAVEGSIKLARYYTGRKRFISFLGAFHGRTMGSLSLTASKEKQKNKFFPLMPGTTHVPFAYCYRCAYKLEYPSCELACVKFIEEEIFEKTVPPEEVAAIVTEPIQGEGGYVVPPPEYHKELKKLAEKYEILFLADEVQAGMGRTGKMFAMEHYGVEADIITLAKGIASGMVVGPIIAKASMMVWKPGSHGNTFGGNPVACAAALETIQLLEESLMKNAAEVGGYLLDKLKELQKDHWLIGDVRGKGLMIGVEFVRDRETKEMAIRETDNIVVKLFKKGVLTLPCGPNVIRFSPPLLITKAQIDIMLGRFDETLSEIEAG